MHCLSMSLQVSELQHIGQWYVRPPVGSGLLTNIDLIYSITGVQTRIFCSVSPAAIQCSRLYLNIHSLAGAMCDSSNAQGDARILVSGIIRNSHQSLPAIRWSNCTCSTRLRNSRPCSGRTYVQLAASQWLLSKFYVLVLMKIFCSI